jgi:hypothetical protein
VYVVNAKFVRYGLVTFFYVPEVKRRIARKGREGRQLKKERILSIVLLRFCVYYRVFKNTCVEPAICPYRYNLVYLSLLSSYYVETSLNRGLATSHGPCISLPISLLLQRQGWTFCISEAILDQEDILFRLPRQRLLPRLLLPANFPCQSMRHSLLRQERV